MIKIGDFSKLGHVTVKALHHYDELGLLKPAHIDRFTAYRYYTLDQLPRLNRILALKDLGFSLDQVAQLLDDNLSTVELRGMLRMKQSELAERVMLEESRLARVERRLQQIESQGSATEQEIAIKEIGQLHVLSTHGMAANDAAFLLEREKLQDLLQQNLVHARLKPTGPWFVMLEELPNAADSREFELAVPINPGKSQRAGDWTGTPISLRSLSAVHSMASVIHEGDYNTINQTYTNLYAWFLANAYKISGPCREVYLPQKGINIEETQDAQTGFFELQCPVERASIPISLRTNQINRKENIMNPEFVSRPAMTVVGLSYIGKNENQEASFNQEIAQMWGELMSRNEEIKHTTGQCTYGACFSQPKWEEEGEFEYVACFEVTDSSELPEGMVVRQVPAYRYAVFTHKGRAINLGETYKYIYETWLPQSGVELHPDKFDMELYDHRFIPDSDESEFDILVAITG